MANYKRAIPLFLVLLLRTHLCVSQYRRTRTYGSEDVYFTVGLGPGLIQYPPSSGKLSVAFPYTIQDANGNITQAQFNSSLPISYQRYDINYNTGSYMSFELGNYRYFFNGKIGGAGHATNFSASVGMNFYFAAFANSARHSKICLAIKPSIGIGISQSFPNNRNKVDDNYLGSIDNENKYITALGNTFEPFYQQSSGSSSNSATTTVQAKTIDVYYFQNSYFIVPSISIGKNNYERLFYFDINLAYYWPFNLNNGIQLYQNKQDSQQTAWLDGNNSINSSFNGFSVSRTPSIYEGLYAGITIGLNFSREIFGKYGTENLKRTHDDLDLVCHCEPKRSAIKETHSKSKQTKSLRKKGREYRKVNKVNFKKKQIQPAEGKQTTRGW